MNVHTHLWLLFVLALFRRSFSSALCREGLVKTCKLTNYSYQLGDLKQTWNTDLALESSFFSDSDGVDKIEFCFLNGKVALHRENLALWPELCGMEHEVVVVLYRNFKNIFHLLMDQLLPYALALREFGLQDIQTKLIVMDSPNFHGHRADVFEMLDHVWSDITGHDPIDWENVLEESFCAKQILFVQPGRRFKFETNFVQDLQTVQELRPAFLWFSAWVKTRLGVENAHAKRGTCAILLDRSRAGYRRLLHSASVMQALQDREWNASLLHFEDLTFSEQVQALASADVLIAPHGAAMANLMFMPPWAVVVELRPHGFGNRSVDFWQGYGNLARAARRSYIAWHDPFHMATPSDHKGYVDFKDSDVAIGQESLASILDVVVSLLDMPLTHRNFDETIDMNVPTD